jgi:hypothetical protein
MERVMEHENDVRPRPDDVDGALSEEALDCVIGGLARAWSLGEESLFAEQPSLA